MLTKFDYQQYCRLFQRSQGERSLKRRTDRLYIKLALVPLWGAH